MDIKFLLLVVLLVSFLVWVVLVFAVFVWGCAIYLPMIFFGWLGTKLEAKASAMVSSGLYKTSVWRYLYYCLLWVFYNFIFWSAALMMMISFCLLGAEQRMKSIWQEAYEELTKGKK